jgi:hypothetical protein
MTDHAFPQLDTEEMEFALNLKDAILDSRRSTRDVSLEEIYATFLQIDPEHRPLIIAVVKGESINSVAEACELATTTVRNRFRTFITALYRQIYLKQEGWSNAIDTVNKSFGKRIEKKDMVQTLIDTFRDLLGKGEIDEVFFQKIQRYYLRIYALEQNLEPESLTREEHETLSILFLGQLDSTRAETFAALALTPYKQYLHQMTKSQPNEYTIHGIMLALLEELKREFPEILEKVMGIASEPEATDETEA